MIFKITIATCLLALFAIGCSTQGQKITAQEFWTEFRQAVLENDNTKLADMTQLPLEIRGVDDSQPAQQYNKDQFGTIFAKILDQPVTAIEGEKIVTNTTRDIINSTKTITKEQNMTSDSFRVDQLVFEFKNGQWKLVRVYLEE